MSALVKLMENLDDLSGLTEDELVRVALKAPETKKTTEQSVAAELARRGWSWRRIGKALGVNYTTAYGWVRDAGLLPSIEAALRARGESVDLDREDET